MKKKLYACTLLIAAQAYCADRHQGQPPAQQTNHQTLLTSAGIGFLAIALTSDNPYVRGAVGVAGVTALLYANRPAPAQQEPYLIPSSPSSSATVTSNLSRQGSTHNLQDRDPDARTNQYEQEPRRRTRWWQRLEDRVSTEFGRVGLDWREDERKAQEHLRRAFAKEYGKR